MSFLRIEDVAVANLSKSFVTEPDEAVAPVVFLYIFGAVAWLTAIIAWVFFFRGYA